MEPVNGLANDAIQVIGSGAAYTLTVVSLASVNNITASSNSDYAAAQVGVADTQLEYKLVSAGLKIRYIGTELERGGQLIGLQDQNHKSMEGRSLASVSGEETSKRFPIDRKWKRVLFRPIDDDDLDFQNQLHVYTPAATDPTFYMGFIVQAPDASTSISFEFEAYANFEVMGRIVRGATKSHVDPVGAGAVQAVIATGSNLYPTDVPSGELEARMVHDVAHYVQEHTTTFHKVQKGSAPKANSGKKKSHNSSDDESSFWDDLGNLAGKGLLMAGESLLDWLFL